MITPSTTPAKAGTHLWAGLIVADDARSRCELGNSKKKDKRAPAFAGVE